MYNSPVDTPQGSRQTKYPNLRAVAQSGSALAWGARGRGFESRLPDEIKTLSNGSSAAERFCFVHPNAGFGFACFTGYAETGWRRKLPTDEI